MKSTSIAVMAALAAGTALVALPAAAAEVDVSPLTSWAAEIAGAALLAVATAILSWVGPKLARFVDQKTIDLMGRKLLEAIGRSVTAGITKYTPPGQPVTVDVRNEVLAHVLGYIVPRFRETMTKFGWGEQKLLEVIDEVFYQKLGIEKRVFGITPEEAKKGGGLF